MRRNGAAAKSLVGNAEIFGYINAFEKVPLKRLCLIFYNLRTL